MNLYISVLGKLVFDFFVILKICVNFRVIFESATFAGIIFHFFEDSRVRKARKLHQTRSCPFDELADGGLRTNHSDSSLFQAGSLSVWTIPPSSFHFGIPLAFSIVLTDREPRTGYSYSNLEGLESAIMYKSLWTNLHFGVFAHTSDANTTSPA